MDGQSQRAVVERIDYAETFRFTRLFGCFRLAIHPGRLLLALLLIMLLYIGGRVMDWAWGGRVVAGEFTAFVQSDSVDAFHRWKADAATGTEPAHLTGVFETALERGLGLFDQMVAASLQFHLGIDQLAPATGQQTDEQTSLIGAARRMAMLPAWLWHAHGGFLLLYLGLAILLWSLIGGAISRQTMVEAARGRLVPASEAFGYAWRWWGWYLLSPLLPLLIVGLVAGLVALGGLALFNVSGLDILGGLLFVLALGLGFVMTLLLVCWAAGVHLVFPAVSAEGTDAFDAMSRAFSYVLARPWRLVFYTLVAIAYGVVTYLFVGLFVYLTIWLTQWAVNLGALTAGPGGATRFEAMLPPPQFGRLSEMPALEGLNWPGRIAGVLVRVWVYLLVGTVGAYLINFYHAASSVIYLLLRRYADGTDTAEVFEPQAETPAVQEKVESSETPEAQEGVGG